MIDVHYELLKKGQYISSNEVHAVAMSNPLDFINMIFSKASGFDYRYEHLLMFVFYDYWKSFSYDEWKSMPFDKKEDKSLAILTFMSKYFLFEEKLIYKIIEKHPCVNKLTRVYIE
ncbi:MAG: hypothetical protein ACI85I_002645 [Arenicella sp.]|jgi:hypothetical protein